jgi:hypothetical protein
MMRGKKRNLCRLILLALCFFPLGGLHAQTDPSLYKEAYGFSGPVRKAVLLVEIPEGGRSTEWEFSEDGYIVSHRQNYGDGAYNEKVYSYDSRNRLTEFAEYRSSHSPRLKKEYRYKFDGSSEIRIFSWNYNTGLYLQRVSAYDSEGERVSEIQYTPAETTLWEYFVADDVAGKREEYHHYDYDGNKTYYQIRRYDSRGMIISQEQRSTSLYTGNWKWEYHYDQLGRIDRISFIHTNLDGTQKAYWDYAYTGNRMQPDEVVKTGGSRNLLEHRYFFYDGTFLYREKADIFHFKSGEALFNWEYSYDEHGNTLQSVYTFHPAPFSFIKDEEFSADSVITESALYNDAGFEVEGLSRRYNPDNQLMSEETRGRNYERKVYEYDESGRMLSLKVFNQEGQVRSAVTHRYDEEGRETATHRYGPGHQLRNATIINYVYDDYGNWTEARTYYTDNIKEEYERLQRVEKRDIGYFPQ